MFSQSSSRATIASGARGPEKSECSSSTKRSKYSAWRARISSRSPLSSSRAAAYSRIVSSMRIRPRSETHEVVLDEALQRAEHALDLLVRADALRRRDRPAAGEDREPGEERPLRRVEQVVAPCDRRRQRALAVRQIRNASADDVEPVHEPFEQRGRIEHPQPGRRELDRQ